MISEFKQHCGQWPARIDEVELLGTYQQEAGIARWVYLNCRVCGEEWKEWLSFEPKWSLVDNEVL